MTKPWACKCVMCARLREHTRELHDATRDETLQILTDMQVKWLFVIADQVRGSDKVDTKDRLIDNLRERVKELDALLAHSRFRLGKSQRDAALLSDDVDWRDKLIKGMAKAEQNAGTDDCGEGASEDEQGTNSDNDDDDGDADGWITIENDSVHIRNKGVNNRMVKLTNKVQSVQNQLSMTAKLLSANREELEAEKKFSQELRQGSNAHMSTIEDLNRQVEKLEWQLRLKNGETLQLQQELKANKIATDDNEMQLPPLNQQTGELRTHSTDKHHNCEKPLSDPRQEYDVTRHLVKQPKGKDYNIDSFKFQPKNTDERLHLLEKQLQARCNEVAELAEEGKSKDTQIASYKAELKLKSDEVLTLKSDIRLRCDQIGTLMVDLRKKDANISTLKSNIKTKEDQITELKSDITDLRYWTIDNSQANALETIITHMNNSIKALRSIIVSHEATSKSQNQEIRNLNAMLATRETTIAHAKNNISTSDQQCISISEQIKQLEDTITRLKATIGYDDEMIDNINKEGTDCLSMMQAEDEYSRKTWWETKDLKTTLAARNAEIKTLKGAIVTKDNDIASLQADLISKQEQLAALTPSPEQEAQATILEIERDWEDKMAQLQAVETKKDEFRRRMREMEDELKQADERLMAKEEETPGWKKRLLKFDDSIADSEPLHKRVRRVY